MMVVKVGRRTTWGGMAEQVQTFEPFAREGAYIRVNEKLVDRMLKRLPRRSCYQVLDIAAGTGLMTELARCRAHALGAEIESVVLDADLFSLKEARRDVPASAVRGYVCASADQLPFGHGFDLAIFANSLHLLDDPTTFYKGAALDDSKAFYGRWIRRAVAEINQADPHRTKSDRAQSAQPLDPSAYQDLIACTGFRVLEVRERRVLLSQAAVRAISGYRDFAMGALRASEEDAEEAARALQSTVQQAFRDLHMKYLPRNWLEIIAVRP